MVYHLSSVAYPTAMVQEQANPHLHNRLLDRFRPLGPRIHKSDYINLFHQSFRR